MIIYQNRPVAVNKTPKWQTLVSAVGRRKLESKRGKKLICKSCRKEIVGDKMVIAHVDGHNYMVHPLCADHSVKIKAFKPPKETNEPRR